MFSKNIVNIVLVNGLEEDKEYTINISKDMSGKYGVTLGYSVDKSYNSGQASDNNYYLWIAAFIIVVYILRRKKYFSD